MADSAVSFLVEKLSSLLEEEAKLFGGIREDAGFVKDELQSMEAFLQNADADEDEDPEMKAWVKQVREVAYDAEDVLDEFLYRFEHPRRGGFYGRLCRAARTIRTLKARRRVASEMKMIKSRVTSISQRRGRYSRNTQFNVTERGSSISSATNNARNDACLLQESQLVGIDQPKRELVSWLLEDAASSSQVVAVVGMGGLGKTTLVNQVYRDAEVEQRFEHRAWVTVSQSFNPRELLVKMIEQLFKGIEQPIPNEANSGDISALKKVIIGFLRDKKYLIVLDDLWTVDSWSDLKCVFPADNSCGSRLIVTTRDSDMAKTTTKDVFRGTIYYLKTLSQSDSWDLFCERTFQGESCPQHLVKISRRILNRCMGLPLAIVAISGLLATKDTSETDEWDLVSRSLGVEMNNNDKLRSMRRVLSLSFSDLSYQLKSCFLYLSLFLEDLKFSKQYVITLWISNGFVQEMKNRTVEEVGEVYFNELCNRSLIQIAKEEAYEGYHKFQVHDLVREIIIEKSKDQNFAAIATDKNPFLSGNVRHLYVSTKRLEHLQGEEYDFSRLRSLLFFNAQGSICRFSMTAFFSKHKGIRLLRVLDCGGLTLDAFPHCITKLHYLRYLSMYGTSVASIPSSIWRLRSLEMLDLGETFIEELPFEIIQLRHLRHIKVFRTENRNSLLEKRIGAGVPTEIGELTSLQSLYKIRARHGCVDLMRSLGNLTQLRTLDIQELGAEHGPALCSSIDKLSRLRELYMEAREEATVLDVQNVSSPPECLRRLDIYGRLEKLPHWVRELSSLVLLKLRWSKLSLDPLESLQSLPHLQHLVIEKAYDGDKLCVKAGGFKMLKVLILCGLDKLRLLTVEKGAMPRLQCLRLEDCKLMEEVPSGVESLTELQELVFFNMGDELVAKLHSSSQNSDLLRVKGVPRVFTGSRDEEGLCSGWYRILTRRKGYKRRF